MTAQPVGTVTLLFTDVQGSTRLLERLGTEPYAEMLEHHRRLLRDAFTRNEGYEFGTEGDAFFVAFARAGDALTAAGEAQQALEDAEWPDGVELRVRMGVHTGDPTPAGSNYVGIDLHRVARIMSAGHGGQVVVSQATRALVDAELSQLGEHRLKDFDEPIVLFQLGSRQFPPLKTISNTNLPRPASSLVGREREREALTSMLQNGSRLVTLTGPGGSGKTRLALEVAAELVPAFAAGVFWADVAPLRDPALVTETLAQTLGAKESLAEHVADRELLLVVDNFEQVAEAAPELADLLSRCGNLRFLVTSRELLRVSGEVEYPVPPLEEAEAVDLFCARSRLDPDPTITVLCGRLDNMPLAVELAAARARLLTPAQILGRLSQQLDLLKGGRDADPRQQTLRATIEWSHQLLSPEEQTLFRRLAVFRGGCTLEAAEEVADADLDTLQSLLDKSLLRHANGRFWMLETIRAYAWEQLSGSTDETELRERHALCALDITESEDPELHNELDLAIAYAHIDAELENIRAALEWARDSSQDEILLRLTASLSHYWPTRGLFQEKRSWNALALECGSSPAKARMTVLNSASADAMREGDWDRADALVTEWLRIAEEEGNEHEALRARNAAALNASDKGDFEEARRQFSVVGRRAADAGDQEIVSFVAVNLSVLSERCGEFEAGLEYAAEAAQLFRQSGDVVGLSVALGSSACCSLALSDPAQAAGGFREAMDLIAGQGAFLTRNMFGQLWGFAVAIVALNEMELGTQLFAAAESLREALGASLEDEREEQRWESSVAAARANLGEAAFAAAWEHGKATTPEDAVLSALALPLDALADNSHT